MLLTGLQYHSVLVSLIRFFFFLFVFLHQCLRESAVSLWKGSGPLMCSPSRVPHSTRMLLIRFLNHSSFCSTFGLVGVHYHWLLYQVESLRGREGLSSERRGLRFTIMEGWACWHEGNLILATMLSVLTPELHWNDGAWGQCWKPFCVWLNLMRLKEKSIWEKRC